MLSFDVISNLSLIHISDMKRLKYVRYADDFLIGVIGSKEDCIKIKEDIKQFMADKLKLELSLSLIHI